MTLPATRTGRRLIDLGCGTGLDAVRLAEQGHEITATDFSPRMTARTRERAQHHHLTDRVTTLTVGAHELARIEGSQHFDGAYSNLGALNCVPNLSQVAAQCARLLKPRGALVFAVIGRLCPWEIAHYALRAQPARIRVRFAAGMVPVNMNEHVVWTRYYSPREFYRSFEPLFTLQHYQGLCVFAPPPYLTQVKEKHPRFYQWLWSMDRRLAAWPGVRALGDHFLMILRRR